MVLESLLPISVVSSIRKTIFHLVSNKIVCKTLLGKTRFEILTQRLYLMLFSCNTYDTYYTTFVFAPKDFSYRLRGSYLIRRSIIVAHSSRQQLTVAAALLERVFPSVRDVGTEAATRLGGVDEGEEDTATRWRVNQKYRMVGKTDDADILVTIEHRMTLLDEVIEAFNC
ncbi:hypothetical protein QTP88_022233 [Uroleucon formosanum]